AGKITPGVNTAALEATDYDGVFMSPAENTARNPNQIKSATGNQGTFSDSGNILAAQPLGPKPTPRAALAQLLDDAGKPFESLPTARQTELLAEASRQTTASAARLRDSGRIRPDGRVLAPNGQDSTLFSSLLDETGNRADALRL